jgi:hypothetical protein
MGMESVRLIREDPTRHPEEATIQAIRRLITGEGAAPAPTGADAPAPAKKRRKKAENE